MFDVIFDMETADPDDALTLCWLAGNPNINLVSVTITPGTKEQVGLVRHLLNRIGKNIPIGSKNIDHPKQCVSAFHIRWLKSIANDMPDGEGHDIIAEAIKKFPDVVLLTGAALGNPRLFLQNHPGVELKRWVGQGGFAGDNLVAEKDRLDKFKGKVTCPTFNFNGDVPGAQLMLSSKNIINRMLVSKNVCHGIVYDQELHNMVGVVKDKNLGLQLMHEGMSVYLDKRSEGKMFHDPLDACCMINPKICEFKEVEMYREKGE